MAKCKDKNPNLSHQILSLQESRTISFQSPGLQESHTTKGSLNKNRQGTKKTT